MSEKKIKVLIAKPGLDGHDVGAKIVVRTLQEAGFEVIYTGLRKTADEIAATARDENVDVIGLSILSGSHLPLCRKLKQRLADYVHGVFPFGTPLSSIVEFIQKSVS